MRRVSHSYIFPDLTLHPAGRVNVSYRVENTGGQDFTGSIRVRIVGTDAQGEVLIIGETTQSMLVTGHSSQELNYLVETLEHTDRGRRIEGQAALLAQDGRLLGEFHRDLGLLVTVPIYQVTDLVQDSQGNRGEVRDLSFNTGILAWSYLVQFSDGPAWIAEAGLRYA